MGLSPEQVARRLAGITATDVAAIVGLHPNRSIINVWREKRGEDPPSIDTDRTRWGEALEPLIRADYERRHGVRVEVPGTYEHPDHPWMLSTPDGVAWPDGPGDPLNGLEIKCHTIRLAWMYGPEFTDEVPPHELCQCSWGMAVTGLVRWDLVAFIDGQPREYTIDRDDELIGDLVERAERFHIDNVKGGQVPDPDGSEAYGEWLKGRWASNTDDLIDIGNDLDTFEVIERAKAIKAQDAANEKELESIIQRLKAMITDKSGLTWRDGHGKVHKVTWRRTKPGKRVDTGGMITDIRNRAGLAASAHVKELREALPALMNHGGHIGKSTVSGVQLAKIIETLVAELTGIARVTDKAYTTEIPGNRPFNWPHQWQQRKERKE